MMGKATRIFLMVCLVWMAVMVFFGVLIWIKPQGAEKKECEVERYTSCVPVCITKNIADCREKSGNGFTKNPVFDFAMCMKTTCHPLCEIMAWSNCYLPEADRLKWKD